MQLAALIGYCSKHGGTWGIPVGYRHKTIYQYWPHLPLYRGRSLPVWAEPSFEYTEIPKHGKGIKLHGFFQSLKYFEHCQDEVRHWIRLIETPIERVSIHIRRGDYVTMPDNFPPITDKYITESILHFNSLGYRRFLVLSDDIQWCKNYIQNSSLSENDFKYSEGHNEYEALSLMASCEHNIISNSSFSWMAAWYNTNKNKIVISPSKETWFGEKNGNFKMTKDLIPESWIQIHTR